VIKSKEIESAMVKAFVSLRNICRVMKLRVVHDADRLELELEAEAHPETCRYTAPYFAP
jgi:hypothetical protein